MHPRPHSAGGYSLIDLMCVVSILATLAGAAVPAATALIERPRVHAAARYLASRMTRVRTQAVMRSATIALRFTPGSDGVVVEEFIDGNRNGVRTADIQSGVDIPLVAALPLADLFPRVQVELPDVTLMSFTPLGTATSLTLYLRGVDGGQYAVRVLGATGRTRVLRYVPATGAWVDAL